MQKCFWLHKIYIQCKWNLFQAFWPINVKEINCCKNVFDFTKYKYNEIFFRRFDQSILRKLIVAKMFLTSQNIQYNEIFSGVLSTAGELDREYQSQYEVQVVVSDGDLFTVTPVYVTVSDVNDNAPRFLENLYRVTVPQHRASRRRTPLVRVSNTYGKHGKNTR